VFTLEQVVPWGRSFDEYQGMFALSHEDLDASFDLALCSHLLFLYSVQLDLGFHENAILEMCRVAREVRIFPLLALGGRRSNYVDLVAGVLDGLGYTVSVERVAYEFQRGGNQMMRIRHRATSARSIKSDLHS